MVAQKGSKGLFMNNSLCPCGEFRSRAQPVSPGQGNYPHASGPGPAAGGREAHTQALEGLMGDGGGGERRGIDWRNGSEIHL